MSDPRPCRICIAVDGPASSGKGTVARMVAAELGYAYVDTGAMYRGIGLACLRAGVSVDDAEGCGRIARAHRVSFEPGEERQRVFLDAEDVTRAIRTPEAGTAASAVARHGPVRSALLQQQRDLGVGGGVVMDGRDIGTVVLPEAELKVFLTASAMERARRRHAELVERGSDRSLEEVAAEIEARDAQDSGRAVAPLAQAEDARRLDTTRLDPEEAARRIVAWARQLCDEGEGGGGAELDASGGQR